MEKLLEQIFAGTLSKNNQRSIEQRNLYSTFYSHEGEDERCKAK